MKFILLFIFLSLVEFWKIRNCMMLWCYFLSHAPKDAEKVEGIKKSHSTLKVSCYRANSYHKLKSRFSLQNSREKNLIKRKHIIWTFYFKVSLVSSRLERKKKAKKKKKKKYPKTLCSSFVLI